MMKLIDDKGRIFGKINVIDFLVILFLFCLIPMFYFGYKVFSRRDNQQIIQKKEFIQIEVNCLFVKLTDNDLASISVGDKDYDEDGEVIGEIVGLESPEPYIHALDMGRGEILYKKDEFLKQIKAKLRLRPEVKYEGLYQRGELLRIGSRFEFNTKEYKIYAVMGKGDKEIKKQKKNLTVLLKLKLTSIKPEVIPYIKNNDKQIEILENGIQRIVARVVRIVSNNPAEVMSLMNEKKVWAIVGHPKYRDLVLEIEAVCERTEKGLFLNDKVVKVGRAFEFSTFFYALEGTVIDINLNGKE